MRIAICLILGLAVCLDSAQASAGSEGPAVSTRAGGLSYKNDKHIPAKNTPQQTGKRPAVRSGSHKVKLYYGVLIFGSNGWCVSRASTTDAKLHASKSKLFNNALETMFMKHQGWDPACLDPATLKSSNPQTMSREQAVDLFWATQVTLPSPSPIITPDISVTGLRTHLTIQGSAPTTFTLPDPLSPEPIIIEATPVYEISWGDGNVDTTTGNGGPASDLYNVYRDLGFYEIIVTAHWEATWRIGQSGAVQGELSGLQTRGTIPKFQVDEIQAVEQPNPTR